MIKFSRSMSFHVGNQEVRLWLFPRACYYLNLSRISLSLSFKASPLLGGLALKKESLKKDKPEEGAGPSPAPLPVIQLTQITARANSQHRANWLDRKFKLTQNVCFFIWRMDSAGPPLPCRGGQGVGSIIQD